MTYTRQTGKTVEQAAADLESALKARGFGVLHAYDFKATLAAKGFPIDAECRVLEVCNPAAASAVLQADMTVNLALPCRISVYEDQRKTRIAMIRPTEQLRLVSQSPQLLAQAVEIDATLQAAIDAAA